MTGIVIADDQDLVRSGLRVLLEARGIEVLAEAADGRQAVQAVQRTTPDVILMDIRMPILDGIAAIDAIVRAGLPTRILVLTTYDLDEYVYGALRAGAAGFLLKATPPDTLATAIHAVATGEALLAPVLTRRLIEEYVRHPRVQPGAVPAQLSTLTSRELEVLRHIGRGLSNDEIARTLYVTEATVKTHVNRLLTKLGLRGRVQAVILAYETGLIRPGEPPAETTPD